jgi:hypothetical protein
MKLVQLVTMTVQEITDVYLKTGMVVIVKDGKIKGFTKEKRA